MSTYFKSMWQQKMEHTMKVDDDTKNVWMAKTRARTLTQVSQCLI